MSIGITGSNENLKITGQTEVVKDPEQALLAMLKEGKILSARILAQSNNNALLKLADLLIPVKTETSLPITTENISLKVLTSSPEQTLLEIIQETKNINSALPEVKVNFTLPEATNDLLNKIDLKAGDSLPVKIIEAGENTIKIQIADQNIELKTQLESLKGENVKVRLELSQDKAPRLILIENGDIIKQAKAEGGKTTESKQLLVFKEENIQLLNKLISEENPKIIISKPQEILDTSIKISFNENEKTLGSLKNMVLESNNLKEGIFEPKEILNLTKLEFNNKTQMAEGFIKNDKLLLKPILEFKDNSTLILKYSVENNKAIFTVDTLTSKENEKAMNLLALKLGEFILEEKKIPEIIKGIIDNKIPLTKENIKSVQSFVNFFPGDTKAGMDMFLNQNLLMGLYYQLNNINDKFLIKGYEKRKGKDTGREKNYEFSILYESEHLGAILVDLEWTDFLNLDFYCEEIDTVNLINNTMEDLKDNLKIKDIKINVEYNQDKVKRKPIKSERISLTNIDIFI